MKLFKSQTVVTYPETAKRVPSHFTDWYEAETVEQARSLWSEDCHRYGIPMGQSVVTFTEVNPETLQPL